MCGNLFGLSNGNNSWDVATKSISMYRADGNRGPCMYSNEGIRNWLVVGSGRWYHDASTKITFGSLFVLLLVVCDADGCAFITSCIETKVLPYNSLLTGRSNGDDEAERNEFTFGEILDRTCRWCCWLNAAALSSNSIMIDNAKTNIWLDGDREGITITTDYQTERYK